MSAKHALLGLLLDRPGYPYQLADQLQQRLGPAWKVNSGQVHQDIKAMEEDGLIERVQSVPTARGDRHVYSITDGGAREFERWFEETPIKGVRLSRRPLLVKITFAGPRRLQDALAQVDAYERECAKRLNEIARLRETLPADGPLIRADRVLLRLSLSADIYQLDGELRWARHAREMLSYLANRETDWSANEEHPGVEQGRHDHGVARRDLFKRMAVSKPSSED
jgi:PadR family transcriptional regulator AphA